MITINGCGDRRPITKMIRVGGTDCTLHEHLLRRGITEAQIESLCWQYAERGAVDAPEVIVRLFLEAIGEVTR